MFHNFKRPAPDDVDLDLTDLASFFVRSGITFRASLHDAGSDDLTATWEFGDGTSVRETFWNNGLSPDPPQSQGGTAPFEGQRDCRPRVLSRRLVRGHADGPRRRRRGHPSDPGPIEFVTGQRSLARRPRAEAVLEARRVLRGERVLLRPLASCRPPAMREMVLGSADHPVPRPRCAGDARRGGAMVPRLRTADGRADLRDRGRRPARRNLGLHKIDRLHRKAEVGIVIGEPTFWSQGYGTEAMRVVLRYGFRRARVNKISLDVLEYNTRALRTYETTRVSSERASTARTSTRTGAS